MKVFLGLPSMLFGSGGESSDINIMFNFNCLGEKILKNWTNSMYISLSG